MPVFPVLANKAPACPHGFKNATTDAKEIERLWSLYPAPLVGVATGAVSNIDALDIDPRHGGDKWLAENAVKIPLTRIHHTRSGGYHYLFRHHAGLRNSASLIAPGVDVRADGGYVVWWPAAGLTVINEGYIAQWPSWLLAPALPKPRVTTIAPVVQLTANRGYAEAALQRAVKVVSSAPEGQRNNALNREAFSLLRFAQAGALSAEQISETLARAALSAGLERKEIIGTLASALQARGIA